MMCRLQIIDGKINDPKYPEHNYERRELEKHFKCYSCKEYNRCKVIDILALNEAVHGK